MILDLDQELTTSGGQTFTATTGTGLYGTRPYDLMTTGGSANDPMVDEPVEAFLEVVTAAAGGDTGATWDVYVEGADDGDGGTNEVVVASKTAIAKATLAYAAGTSGAVMRIGSLNRGLLTATTRYLVAKVKCNYTTTAPTAAKFRVFLKKGRDAAPFNAGVKL
jgi:hypothetical protein